MRILFCCDPGNPRAVDEAYEREVHDHENNPMAIRTEPYSAQASRWPSEGRHILAQFDDEFVVVYQAYRHSIGHFAAQNGHFGGDFKLSRMSWIKPNFLWMMYRCGWGQKEDQEVILAVRIKRSAFDLILAEAVHSSFEPEVYASYDDWKESVERSDVRLQWDPDHHPSGAPLARRAIQLGLRGSILARYAREWIVGIEDISEFVRDQHKNVAIRSYTDLIVPSEAVYPVEDHVTSQRLGLSKWECR